MDIITQLGLPVIFLYMCIEYAANIGTNFNTIRIIFDLIEHVVRIFLLLQLSAFMIIIIDLATWYNAHISSRGDFGSGKLYETLFNLTNARI